MKFDMSKYRFVSFRDTVVAISTFAGKTVRGVARCNPTDTFDLEKGKELAATRCALKIARKRNARANRKVKEAIQQVAEAQKFLNKMSAYKNGAEAEMNEILNHLYALGERM